MNAQHYFNLQALDDQRTEYNAPMTREEFITHWLGCGDGPYDIPGLEAICEGIAERISEFGSECALFGDAGPGSLLRLRSSIERVQSVVSRLNAFGCNITPPVFSIPMLGAHACQYDPRDAGDNYNSW